MTTAVDTGNELLVVDGLQKYFPVTRGIVFQKEIATVKAVDGVSFSLREGETLGIVGESGCGKSTLVRCILKLLEPTGGRIVFQGQDITGLSRRENEPLRKASLRIAPGDGGYGVRSVRASPPAAPCGVAVECRHRDAIAETRECDRVGHPSARCGKEPDSDRRHRRAALR